MSKIVKHPSSSYQQRAAFVDAWLEWTRSAAKNLAEAEDIDAAFPWLAELTRSALRSWRYFRVRSTRRRHESPQSPRHRHRHRRVVRIPRPMLGHDGSGHASGRARDPVNSTIALERSYCRGERARPVTGGHNACSGLRCGMAAVPFCFRRQRAVPRKARSPRRTPCVSVPDIIE
jgi:hypothetical protein